MKRSTAPEASASLLRSRDDLGQPDTYLVHPDSDEEPYKVNGVTVIGLGQLVEMLNGR
ncbi:hypothetical protein [Microbacterium sp. 18062]|uniref:hypothetical protein n=1 Tax=Microbacterium sp. 18062 TaxID=2681410 RepID=UPI00190F64EE|nr:hypothetical protein [Microbacterium sp. 18062]